VRTLSGKKLLAPIAAVIALALAGGFSASTASAASPASVAIQATVTIPNPIFGGVWQASGAINDSGTFVRTDLNLTGSLANSPVVGALQVLIAFSGSQGTFTVMDELLFTTSGLTGNWQVMSGTGAYDGMSGHGTSNFDFATSTIYFTGVISMAG
jgi:Protein of unknown function (DUF3224)